MTVGRWVFKVSLLSSALMIGLAAHATPPESKCPFHLMRGPHVYRPSLSTAWDQLTTFKIDQQSYPQRNMTARIDPAQQFLLDEQFQEQIEVRQKMTRDPRIAAKVVRRTSTPGAKAASHELLQMLAEQLSAQHPEFYSFHHGVLLQKHSGKVWNVKAPSEDPLAIAGQLVQEDLVLVKTRADGRHHIEGGFLANPSLWSLDRWMGHSMEDIHENISTDPAKSEELTRIINNLLKTIQPDNIVLRNNWFIYDDPTLSQPDYRKSKYTVPQITAQNAGENLFLRVERQTLRRLPQSGFVLFTIRVYTFRLSDVARFPEVAYRLGNGLIRYSQDEGQVKTAYHDIVLRYLAPAAARYAPLR